MSSIVTFEEALAFHPGTYIADYIEEIGFTQKEFAARAGISGKAVSELVNGKANLTASIAYKLAAMTDISFATWMNLQTSYEEVVEKIKNAQGVSEDRGICQLISYKYLTDHGFLEKKKGSRDRVLQLRQYLQVSRLTCLKNEDLLVRYRNSSRVFSEKNTVNANIFVQLALNISNNRTPIAEFSRAKLRQLLPDLRQFAACQTLDFIEDLTRTLQTSGIEAVFLPSMPNSAVNGASRPINHNRVLLLISDRRKRADIFWFTFFHEIAHVLTGDFSVSIGDEIEDDADSFARDFLIPEYEYEAFKANQNSRLTEQKIREFADELEIHPGIVVGRLQNDAFIGKNQFNHLRVNYAFETDSLMHDSASRPPE